jgi:hypothetical protein
MNILQQYQKAVRERGHRGTRGMMEVEAYVKVGEKFVYAGYDREKVGDTISIKSGGFAKIISIDAQGFKTARRTQ